MEEHQVRAALWLHVASRTGTPAPEEARDPNALLPAAPLRRLLEQHAEAHGPETLRRLAHDYVDLWSRTFRTLVRHLRGRPEYALGLLADEVYPFLVGQRRGARIEGRGRGRARLVLAEALPPEYLAGLVEAFGGLSGAHCACEARGHEVFDVRHRVPPADRMARLFAQIADMRVPFLLSAVVAALVGLAGAAAAGPLDPMRAVLVAVGVVGVQGAANALHDLRGRPGGPFDAPPLPRWMLWATVGAGYTGGAVVGGYLIATVSAWIAAWAAAGLVLSLLYALFEDQGYGPFLAGLTYGPLVATGALHALAPGAPPDVVLSVVLAGLPLGSLAAALVYINDLADRPLDQAAGRRTLLVRLPRRSHVVGYAVLVGLGAVGLLAAAWWHGGPWTYPAALELVAAAALTRAVARHVEDPHGLAPARLGTLAFHLATGLGLAALILETPA